MRSVNYALTVSDKLSALRLQLEEGCTNKTGDNKLKSDSVQPLCNIDRSWGGEMSSGSAQSTVGGFELLFSPNFACYVFKDSLCGSAVS